MPPRSISLVSGSFSVPAAAAFVGVQLTAVTAATVTIYDPDGAVWYAAQLAAGSAATLGGVGAVIRPGTWRAEVTGQVTAHLQLA